MSLAGTEWQGCEDISCVCGDASGLPRQSSCRRGEGDHADPEEDQTGRPARGAPPQSLFVRTPTCPMHHLFAIKYKLAFSLICLLYGRPA